MVKNKRERGGRERERVKFNIFNYHSKMVGEREYACTMIKNEAAITQVREDTRTNFHCLR